MSGAWRGLLKGAHVHFVGIGGSGLSAIARVLLGREFRVTGSDMKENDLIETLRSQGARIVIGHHPANIGGADVVVVSSAIPATNVEVVSANEAGIPVLKRADFVGELMAGYLGIAVAGSHGKTTTTAMIAQVLIFAGEDPTVILGGVLPEWGSNGRTGAGRHFVVEADEYDYMFLGLKPQVAVITNIEHDHPDIFPTHESYLQAFCQFASLLPPGGKLVACGEDTGVAQMLAEVVLGDVNVISYGIASSPSAEAPAYEFQALDCRSNQFGGTDFLLENRGAIASLIRLRLPGLHNVRNALAAAAVASELGFAFNDIREALAAFGGVGRRFQVLGEVGGVTFIDDYAHHPTEIRATLAAARQRYGQRRLWAVWQPHTYSRTNLLLDEFAQSFGEADRVVVLEVFRSRELGVAGIDSTAIVEVMHHPATVAMPHMDQAIHYLLDRVRPDDVVLTLGAGDGNLVGEAVLAALQDRVHSFRP